LVELIFKTLLWGCGIKVKGNLGGYSWNPNLKEEEKNLGRQGLEDQGKFLPWT